MYTLSRRSGFHRQQGAALVFALVMLLLLTLLGVAGMRDTLLQEKMVAAMRDRDLALQAAEAALREAESSIVSVTPPVFTNSNGLYDVKTTNATNRVKGGNPISEVSFWGTEWTWTDAKSVPYSLNLDGVNDVPRYVIERLDPLMTCSERKCYPQPTGTQEVGCVSAKAQGCAFILTQATPPEYRVTARAVGATPDTVVILQSTVRTN